MADTEAIRNEGAWSRDPQSRLVRDQDALSPGLAGWGEPGGVPGPAESYPSGYGGPVVEESYAERGEAPLRGVPSTAAVGGHPIHPMLVPFPIVFLTTALATDLAARRTGDPFWAEASRWLLRAGLVSGVAAGTVGAIDFLTVRRARERTEGPLHAIGNAVALALTAANLAARRDRPEGAEPGTGEILLSAATAAILGFTAWAGGELSYRHMIGVSGHDDRHRHEE